MIAEQWPFFIRNSYVICLFLPIGFVAIIRYKCDFKNTMQYQISNVPTISFQVAGSECYYFLFRSLQASTTTMPLPTVISSSSILPESVLWVKSLNTSLYIISARLKFEPIHGSARCR